MRKELSDSEFEKILIDVYEQDQNECNEKFGGIPVHYTIEADRCQKLFWKLYRIPRPEFLRLFARFYELRPKPLYNETQCVNVYGGPTGHYRRSNWVEIDGRHYLQIRIALSEYRKMREREKENKEK